MKRIAQQHWTQWVHELVLASLLAAILGGAWLLEPPFVNLDTQRALSLHVGELAMLSLPMTLIIITGGIDLSVGSIMALAAVTFGMAHEASVPLPAAALLSLAVGALAGAINGVCIAWLRIHPLIVTLATMAAVRGTAEGISSARPISGFPADMGRLVEGQLAGLPLPAWLFLVGAVGCAWILAATPLGRALYAIGHNETACRFSGLPVDRIKGMLYVSSGATAALAALVFVARRNTAKADIATGMELEVITAVVLGGTSIFGGRGHIVGTVLGVLVLHELREFVSWRWHHDELIWIVAGLLLISSVLLRNMLGGRGEEER